MVKRCLILLLSIFLCSCDSIDLSGFFVAPSARIDTRFKASMLWNSTHPLVCIDCSDTNQYGFLVCADVHIDQQSKNLQTYLNALRNNSFDRFGVFVGDMSCRRGCLPNFVKALTYDNLHQATNDTVLVGLGNHELFFNEWTLYEKYFGTSVYYFTVKTAEAVDLYIMLDSASGTLGPLQQTWLSDLLKDKRGQYRHCFIFSHTNLFNTEGSQLSSGNMPLEETLWLTDLLSRYKVDYLITGHDHLGEEFSYDGIEYVILDALKDDNKQATYLAIDVAEQIKMQFIPVEK